MVAHSPTVSLMVVGVDGVLLVDADGRIGSVDAGVHRLLGYRTGELVGWCWWELVDPADRLEACAIVARCARGDGGEFSPMFRVCCRHVDGSWRRCEVLTHRRVDGMVVVGLRAVAALPVGAGMGEDLAGRAGFSSRYDCVLVVDRDAVITRVEERVRDLLGFEPVEVVGRGVWEFVHPDDVDAAAGAFGDEVACGEYRGPTKVIRCRRADVGWRRCEVHGRNRLADPTVRGVVVALRYVGPVASVAPGRVAAAAWVLLTRAELDIVTAVSCGLSNKQIAMKAAKSTRTVESQLRAVYRKLGIGSRSELVAAALAR